MPGFQDALARVSAAVMKERITAREKLTEAQLIEALRQALACGDFTRLCVVNSDRQGVVYVPFQECERLKARIRELESELVREQDAALDSDHL